MTGWAELLATATLGTDRRPDADPDDVLAAAAAHCPYRRAGWVPAAGLPASPAAPPESIPVVPAAAASRLASMLDGSQPGGPHAQDRAELLGEWLELAARRGWRVPPELLPALLTTGRKHQHLRERVVAVGGERVGWLAAQRDEWRPLTGAGDAGGADAPTIWSQGTAGQRIGYLTEARRRDPDAAREFLAGQWSGLPADERARLLDTFAHRLGLADEDFVESALDDRSKQVREVAVSLLGRLPDSRYGARMAQRARACLRIGRRVMVEPPSECDSAMRRDGIGAKPPNGVGERTWWVGEILARTPLKTWDLSLVDAKFQEDWGDIVRDGLVRAVAAQHDAVWAVTLLDQLVAAAVKRPRRIDRQWAETLSLALPPQQLLARAETLLRGDTRGMVWVDRILERCPAPWPVSFGEAVVGGIAALTGSRQASVLDSLCRLAGLRLPPELADRVAQLAHAHPGTDDDGGWALARLTKTLRFRHEMTEELTCPQ